MADDGLHWLADCDPCKKGRHQECEGFTTWCPCFRCVVAYYPGTVVPVVHPRETT